MRLISLQPDADGGWFVRVQSATGHPMLWEQRFGDLPRAEATFFNEGDHQPCAAMAVLMPGRRPMTVRSGSRPVLSPDRANLIQKTKLAVSRAPQP